ncbi:MAG TPA: hypothetical protein PLA71_00925 [Saccharofermentans sp.]|nr:hypothetical protein [Saccharofermentans sp.]
MKLTEGALYRGLPANFQEQVYSKWASVIEEGGDITDERKKLATAIVLENIQNAEDQRIGRLREAYAGIFPQAGMGAQTTGSDGGGQFGAYGDFVTTGVNPNDARIPSIVIPTARRMFPELIAFEVAGVQPMMASVGWAFAIRAKYGKFGKGGAQGVAEGTEIGYNQLDSAFTGASGNAMELSANSYFQAFAGAPGAPNGTTKFANPFGQGATLENSEWWNIGEDMPMVTFDYLKKSVEAKTRKVGAQWTPELAEDMMNTQGVDVNSEMIGMAQYEIRAEIDRQLITEMVVAAINNVGMDGTTPDPRVSTWTPVSADGRNQFERMLTLYTHVLEKSQDIGIKTRRGSATFAIMSPKPVALFEQMGDIDTTGRTSISSQGVGVAKIGTLKRGNLACFRDTFAGGNYILLGYKGPNPYDAGVIYCPYIPLQLATAVGQENFTPRIGVRTRYGILGNVFGAGNYYHLIKLDGMSGTLLNADSGRVFTYN